MIVWANGGYAGELLAFTQYYIRVLIEIICTPKDEPTFDVLPRRWITKPTLS